jgi:transposase
MCILTEIYDVRRFRNEKEFASYLGLIPSCRSSGDRVAHGEMTFRGNKQLGPMIVEAAWVAICRDAGLASVYLHYKQRMKPQEAIVRVARKLSNIIFAVLKNETEYVPYHKGN